MFEQVTPVLQDFVVTLLAGALAVASAFIIALIKKGFNWLDAKIDKIGDEKAKTALDTAKDNLEDIVTTTVTSLQQTLAKDIKESIANNDGKYTRDDLLALGDKAFNSVKAQLTDATRDALATAYSDLDGFIRDRVEAKVLEVKALLANALTPSGLLVAPQEDSTTES